MAPFRIWGGHGFFGVLLVGAVQLFSHTVRAAHADDTAAQALPEPNLRQYELALGASLSAGDGGWGTELGNIVQVYGRYHRGLGVGASYFWLTAPNNEGYVHHRYLKLQRRPPI